MSSPIATTTTLGLSSDTSVKKPSIEEATHFKEFTIRKAGLADYQVSSESSSAEYHFEISLYNPKKRDVILHLGTDNKGPVIGDADLKTFSGHYTLELGDYVHGPVVLERLDKV